MLMLCFTHETYWLWWNDIRFQMGRCGHRH